MHEDALAQRIVEDKAVLTGAGYSIYRPKSIGEVDALMLETGRTQQSAMLSLKNNDFTTANAIFLFLQKDGETVAGVRSKVVDLQDENFESHQRRTIPQWYDTEGDEIEAVAPRLNKLIVGKHLYLGELELNEKHRGKLKVTAAFARYCLALSFMRWPDVRCAYCILPDKHRRIHLDYGYSHFSRNAYKWKKTTPPGGRLHDWGVAVSDRDDLIHDWTNGYWG